MGAETQLTFGQLGHIILGESIDDGLHLEFRTSFKEINDQDEV